MIVIILTIFLFLCYASLIIYYRQAWLQIPEGNGQLMPVGEFSTVISVIIPARNEELNIRACLGSVTDQTYPAHLYEILVVDDFSTDNTAGIVRSFEDKKVTLIQLKDHTEDGINSYKKKAIETAISKARGDIIVTTDADCIAPDSWLQAIASFYEKHHPVFIALPVVFKDANTFLSIFQSLDFMTLQGITGAAVTKRLHTMCNGANLAYEKNAFYEVGGFAGIDNIASGDDMLLMHKISQKYPDRVAFLKSQEVIMQTALARNVKEFTHQRIRWASKSDKYADKKITAVLALVYVFNVWIVFLGIYSFFYHSILPWFIGLLIAKTIIELFFLYPVARFFKKEKLLWWFPLAQPFHILYIIIAGWLGKFGSYTWKGRKVK